LSERFRVTGVDFSAVQIDRARKLVPRASFVRADITQVNFTLGQFDAIVSLFTIIHLPLDEQLPLFRSIHSWLRGAGFLLATVGDRSWTGVEEDWLGVEGATMYWSHADAETYREWLNTLGFRILSDLFEPEGDSGHRLLLARKQPRQQNDA
jgi:SAM-dependent methyltransferase